MKKVFGKALCFLLLVMVYMPAVFSQVTDVNDLPDLIPFRKGKKWGFCDRNKKIIIPVKYDSVSFFGSSFRFNEGPVPDSVACVRQGKKEYCINKAGKRIDYMPYVNDPQQLMVEETRIMVFEYVFIDPVSGKKGLLNKGTFDTILPARYADVRYEGSPVHYVTVKENGKWGVVLAKTQQWLLPPTFDSVFRQYEYYGDTSELYVAWKGNVCGLYKKDSLILPVRFKDIRLPNWQFTKVIFVKDEKGEQLFNFSGKPVTTGPYQQLEQAYSFVKAKRNGKWGLIKYDGKELVACKYDYIDRSDDRGMYNVVYKGRGGWIDKKGTEYFED
jgi:hypothetical protein